MGSSESTRSPDTLDQLHRLRVSLVSFQNEIAPLPATEQDNARNEQFNRLHLQAKTLLNEPEFDTRVPPAQTEVLAAERTQRTLAPRLSAIVILGVVLALLGLGINSVILEDVLINSLGCLVSTVGMILVVGALVVSGMNSVPSRQMTNLGDLYQLCSTLLYEVQHALNMEIPDPAERPLPEVPEIASVVELTLDSLTKQKFDWQQKLQHLEEQRLSLGQNAPMELSINIDFVRRELNRVNAQMDQLRGRAATAASADTGTEPPVPVKPVISQEEEPSTDS